MSECVELYKEAVSELEETGYVGYAASVKESSMGSSAYYSASAGSSGSSRRKTYRKGIDLYNLSEDIRMILKNGAETPKLRFPSGKDVERLLALKIAADEAKKSSNLRALCYYRLAVMIFGDKKDKMKSTNMKTPQKDMEQNIEAEEFMKTPLMLLVDAIREEPGFVFAWFQLAEVMVGKTGVVRLPKDGVLTRFTGQEVLEHANHLAEQIASLANISTAASITDSDAGRILSLSEEMRRRRSRNVTPPKMSKEIREENLYRAILLAKKVSPEHLALAKFHLAKYLAGRGKEEPTFYLVPNNLSTPIHPHRLLLEALDYVNGTHEVSMLTSTRIYQALSVYMKDIHPDSKIRVDDETLSQALVKKKFEKELGKRSLAFWDKKGKLPSGNPINAEPSSTQSKVKTRIEKRSGGGEWGKA